jgi:hypothetical protein
MADENQTQSLGQRQYTGQAAANFGRTQGPSTTVHNDPYGQAGGGTGSITNAASRTPTSARLAQRLRGAHGTGDHGGPLDLSGMDEIISASGLGPKELSPGELMSDADEPTQTIRTQPDGTTLHHRANSDGSVTSSPLGAYDSQARSAGWFGRSSRPWTGGNGGDPADHPHLFGEA